MATVNSICYKTKEPVIYNEGTQWEKSCDEFLAFQCGGWTVEEAQAFCDEHNAMDGWGDLPRYYKGVEWDEVAYLFPGKSAEMVG